MGFNSAFKGLNYFDIPCNICFKEHLPEDGHNSWPKHVAGYAVYNKKIYISVYALGRVSHNDKPSFAPVLNTSIAGRICASDYLKKMKFTKTVAAVTIYGIEVMVRTAIMREPEWHSLHSD